MQELKAGPTETPDNTMIWTRAVFLYPSQTDVTSRGLSQRQLLLHGVILKAAGRRSLWMDVWGECQTLFIMNTCCSLIGNVGKLWTSDGQTGSLILLTASVLCFILSAVKENSSLLFSSPTFLLCLEMTPVHCILNTFSVLQQVSGKNKWFYSRLAGSGGAAKQWRLCSAVRGVS